MTATPADSGDASPAAPRSLDEPRRGRRAWLPTAILAVLLVAVVVIAGLDLTVWSPHSSPSSSGSSKNPGAPGTPKNTTGNSTGNSTGHTIPVANTTVTVVDDAGRSVTVLGVPDRIIVLGPSVMDILFRLGLRADVVGVDGGSAAAGGVYDDYTAGQVANWSLASVPVITWNPTLDVQTVLALDPDLVIAGSGFSLSQLETLQNDDGIPCLYLNPPTLAGIEYDVTIVGDVMRVNATAQALNEQMEAAMVVDAAEVTNNITFVPSVLLTYYPDSEGYWSFGPGSFGNDLLLDAGATSITANDTAAADAEVSGSYVLAANATAIIVGTGFGLTVQNYSQSPDWSLFGAVQAGHVFAMNAVYMSEPDPTMVFELATFITILHPELSGGSPL
jgi:iron complex transport system substrate-binding protein